MPAEDRSALPMPAFAGGTRAITTSPVVGTPPREYPEMFAAGGEALEDGELRVTVLGSGNPWVTRAQSCGSILVEVGNPQRDLLVFDLGSGSLANFAGLQLPVNALDKVFITHLHADHTSDLITLFGSYRKSGRVDRGVRVWGPSGSEPRFGTAHFVDGIREACRWDSESTRSIHGEESFELVAEEFDFSRTQAVYDANGVTVTAFPVIHALSGAVGYRIDFDGLTVVHSGDTRPGWPLVRACEGTTVDLLIHECFPPAEVIAASMDMPIERASVILNQAHTSPRGAGKVFDLVRPRMAALWHTVVTPAGTPLIFEDLRKVYAGPVVQTQDLTVFNVTAEAVVARQAQVEPQPRPVPGTPKAQPEARPPAQPDWWADALIPLDDVLALP
ncbi:MAG: MBL fold metallo-hydrolase [Solirubrobacterales bacterium]|nr:MBL fold metallo-hydrolase [Solirubrobacterales bacterium]